jgi:hypothetical protein
MPGEYDQPRKRTGSTEMIGGGGSLGGTGLRPLSAQIQGKISGKAGKYRLAGYMSQHLWAIYWNLPRKSGQNNREDRRPDQGNARQITGTLTTSSRRPVLPKSHGNARHLVPQAGVDAGSSPPDFDQVVIGGQFFRMANRGIIAEMGARIYVRRLYTVAAYTDFVSVHGNLISNSEIPNLYWEACE